jgi:histidyl-tRNA synthetase
MAIGEFRIRINNRKVLKGLLRHFRVEEDKSASVLRILDKIEKEDEFKTRVQLELQGLVDGRAKRLYDLISVKKSTEEALGELAKYEECAEGLKELRAIVEAIRQFGVPDNAFAVDLSVARGLDYYTGTVYETTLTSAPELGSICSGGRYDDLASYFTDTKLPGVGISIGLTRLFSKLREANLLQPLPRTPAEVLVTTMDQQHLDKYLKMAAALRAAGINTEVYLETAKLGNQLTYADRKGFRLALVAGETEFANNVVQVKDLAARQSRTVPIDNMVSPIKELLKI